MYHCKNKRIQYISMISIINSYRACRKVQDTRQGTKEPISNESFEKRRLDWNGNGGGGQIPLAKV